MTTLRPMAGGAETRLYRLDMKAAWQGSAARPLRAPAHRAMPAVSSWNRARPLLAPSGAGVRVSPRRRQAECYGGWKGTGQAGGRAPAAPGSIALRLCRWPRRRRCAVHPRRDGGAAFGHGRGRRAALRWRSGGRPQQSRGRAAGLDAGRSHAAPRPPLPRISRPGPAPEAREGQNRARCSSAAVRSATGSPKRRAALPKEPGAAATARGANNRRRRNGRHPNIR